MIDDEEGQLLGLPGVTSPPVYPDPRLRRATMVKILKLIDFARSGYRVADPLKKGLLHRKTVGFRK